MSSGMPDSVRFTDPDNFPVRPLNKGIITDVASELIPIGGLLDAANFQMSLRGPQRRFPFYDYAGGQTVSYPPLRGLETFFNTGGVQESIVFDKKFVYVAGPFSLTAKYWTYDTGTIAVSSTSVVGSGVGDWTADTNSLKAGDVIVLDADGSGDGPESATIASIDSNVALTLSASPTGTFGAGTDYSIRRAFNAAETTHVDYVVADNRILFCDGNREVTQYDGTNYSKYSYTADTGTILIPSAIGYHKDRIWMGRIVDGNTTNDYRQRLVWSRVLDRSNFTDPDSGGLLYLDLPYQRGRMRRILPLGDLLVLYFEDAIFIGRPTSFGTTLPYTFERIETGGVGLAGDRAVFDWTDGHFFIGNDDIYFLGNNLSLDRIGSKVIRETLDAAANLYQAFVTYDAENAQMVFGFPRNSASLMDRLWTYSLRTSTWGYLDYSASFVGSLIVRYSITWDTLDSVLSTLTWEGMTAFGTWDQISGNTAPRRLYVGHEGKLQYYAESGSADGGTDPITAVIETPDYDFNRPNKLKTAFRLSIKIDRELANDLVFLVEGSTDRGNNWKTLKSNLTISAGDDEAACTFRMKGSTHRFKLTSLSVVEPYVVLDLTMRLRGGGREVHQGPED